NLILLIAKRFTETTSLHIVGLMFSSCTSALVSVLSYFTTAEELQRYTFWSMGSLGNVSWIAIALFVLAVLVSSLIGVRITKALNALLLGEMYGQSLSVNIAVVRKKIVWITCLLCGGTTAIVGPTAFIGLAVSYISRMIFKS